MKMKSFAYSMMFLFALSAFAAQAPRVKSGQGQTARRPRQEPCWQVAGISKSAMEKHKSLEQSAHSQVQAVCADSSLTPQQKREKIREIHEQTRQQAESLFTPQQHQALKACREERNGGKHMGGGGGKGIRHGEGPCGDMPMGKGPKTPPDSTPPKE